MYKYIFVFLFASLLFSKTDFAQANADTSYVSLPDAEKVFLQKNFLVIAAKYNIDANKALIRQAKLWDNPVLNTDQNVYDGKFFQHNADAGQLYIQVMQLIKTAGKRNKLAQLAADNTKISEEQFDDLVRTLRYTLETDLFEVNHLLKIKTVYQGEIDQLDKLIKGMDAQLESGNISLKDNMRLKALLFGLQNEVVNVESQLMPVQSEIKLLLQDTSETFIRPALAYHLPDLIKDTIPTVEDLVKTALQNRPDAKIAKTQLDLQKDNLVYQKALAKADVSAGLEYDRRNSYNPNYVGLAISLPLNILNRNQGNIKSAQYSIQQQQVIAEGSNAKIENDVQSAYRKFRYFQTINNSEQLDFSKKYDALFQNMLKSYQDRQLSLLEFIDFMDAYKDSKLKLLEQHNSLVRAALDIDFTVASDIIKLN